MGWSDCPPLGIRYGHSRDAFADWYSAWTAQNAARRAAEEAERVRQCRDVRWVSGLIAAWSLVMGGAAFLAIRIVL